MKTLKQTCEAVAKEKYNYRMGGGNDFNDNSSLIAFIYETERVEVKVLIEEAYKEKVEEEMRLYKERFKK